MSLLLVVVFAVEVSWFSSLLEKNILKFQFGFIYRTFMKSLVADVAFSSFMF